VRVELLNVLLLSCFPSFPFKQTLATDRVKWYAAVRQWRLTGEQSEVKLACTGGSATINACCTPSRQGAESNSFTLFWLLSLSFFSVSFISCSIDIKKN
jgi:hypothetical protein